MRKILIAFALIVTAGFFACSDLPSDMNMKNVENLDDPSLLTITLYSYDGQDLFESNHGTPGEVIIDKKGTTISDYLNDCVTSTSLVNYIKCIERKVKKLISKGYISAEVGASIVAWAQAQAQA